jgi:hypothetical protein
MPPVELDREQYDTVTGELDRVRCLVDNLLTIAHRFAADQKLDIPPAAAAAAPQGAVGLQAAARESWHPLQPGACNPDATAAPPPSITVEAIAEYLQGVNDAVDLARETITAAAENAVLGPR